MKITALGTEGLPPDGGRLALAAPFSPTLIRVGPRQRTLVLTPTRPDGPSPH